MHVAHGTYCTGGSRHGQGLTRRNSSGNLSVDGEAEQPSPQGSPGSVGGRSSAALESHIRRVQHFFSVFFGRCSAKHTDFMAKRDLLTRMVLSIAESVTVIFALTVIGTAIFSSLERSSVRTASALPAAYGSAAAHACDLRLTRCAGPSTRAPLCSGDV